jgi:hypothetical protein
VVCLSCSHLLCSDQACRACWQQPCSAAQHSSSCAEKFFGVPSSFVLGVCGSLPVTRGRDHMVAQGLPLAPALCAALHCRSMAPALLQCWWQRWWQSPGIRTLVCAGGSLLAYAPWSALDRCCGPSHAWCACMIGRTGTLATWVAGSAGSGQATPGTRASGSSSHALLACSVLAACEACRLGAWRFAHWLVCSSVC